MSINGQLAQQICSLCSNICRACGDECGKHAANHCKQCADVCRACAEECAKMFDAAA
nr:four-helix bundle copper-binding protein [Flavipsychrobacter sp. JY13-12]